MSGEDSESGSEWEPESGQESNDDDRDYVEGSNGKRKRRGIKKSSNIQISEPIYKAKVKLTGEKFRKELPVDNDGCLCHSSATDLLAVGKASPWPIPIQAHVYPATQGIFHRMMGRVRPYLENEDDWVLLTDEHFTMFIKRAALPKLKAYMPGWHEFVRINRQGSSMAFRKRKRGTIVLQNLLEFLKAITEEEGSGDMGDVVFFQVGDLRPFDGGEPSSMHPPEGQPELTGKMLYDFCSGRSVVRTYRTWLLWVDLGVHTPFSVDDGGKVSWPVWQRRTHAALHADPPVFFGSRVKITTCAMHGTDEAGWATVRWNDHRDYTEKYNLYMKRMVLEALAQQAADQAATTEEAGQEHEGEEQYVNPELFLSNIELGEDIFWMKPVLALEAGAMTVLDFYILLLPVSKITLYWSFRHEWQEWIDGDSPTFPPKSLAPLHTLTQLLKEEYGPYLKPQADTSPERLLGSLLSRHDHYARTEVTYDFRSIGVTRPPTSITVSKMARALEAVLERAVPIDAMPMHEEQWVNRVSRSLSLLSDMLEKVPTIRDSERPGEFKKLHISMADMPESVRIEWIGRGANLRSDIGETTAFDQATPSTRQICLTKKYQDDWLLQLENAARAKELLAADSCSAACGATKAAERRSRIKAIVDTRSAICKKGKNKGRRMPKKGQTVEKLRAEIKAWNNKYFLSRAVFARYKEDRVSTHGSGMELIRRIASAVVDGQIASAQRVAGTQRGELRGVGCNEILPCDIRPNLSREERHQELVKCAEKDKSHLVTWVEELWDGRRPEDQEEWDSDAESEADEDDVGTAQGGADPGAEEAFVTGIFDEVPLQG